MCGRFVRAKMPEVYAKTFDLMGVPSMPSSYNVAPTQPVLAMRMNEAGKECAVLRWGLIPFWAKDKKMNFINARGDTLFEKPAFKAAAKRRRCLILADGYFEWKTLGPKKKQPFYFRLKGDAPFAFAGIWDTWTPPHTQPLSQEGRGELEPIESCAIITTDANELSQPIHDRMPVMLRGAAAEAWLDPAVEELASLAHLLRPFAADDMTCYAVGPLVGNVKNNSPECIEPLV